MIDSSEVAAARIEVERRRARVLEALAAVERPFTSFLHQLTPKHIMREAWNGAKEKGADLAEDAVDAVGKRPLAATGIVAAITLFLAREPLMELAGKLTSGKRGRGKNHKAKTSHKDTEAAQ